MNRFLQKIRRSEVRCYVLISLFSSNSLHTVIPSVSWVQGFSDNRDVQVLHILLQQLERMSMYEVWGIFTNCLC